MSTNATAAATAPQTNGQEPRTSSSLQHSNRKRPNEDSSTTTSTTTGVSGQARPNNARPGHNKQPKTTTDRTPAEVLIWAENIESPLPERPRSNSPKAIITTAAPLFLVKKSLVQVQKGFEFRDITHNERKSDEYIVSNMTPTKWDALDAIVAQQVADKVPPFQVAPPTSYTDWEDRSLVAYMPKSERPLKPKDIAVSFEVAKNMPYPVRIYRMYAIPNKDLEENESQGSSRSTNNNPTRRRLPHVVRLVYENEEQRALQNRGGRVFIQNKAIKVKLFTSPSHAKPRTAPTGPPLN
jgi:hypothetical protein